MSRSDSAFAQLAAEAPQTQSTVRWGVTSETGRLNDVLLCRPDHLAMVPCNAVTRDSLAKGLSSSVEVALCQHDAFAAALTECGVRCHFVHPSPDLADMTFTRDAVLVSPWGLVELRPAAPHRRNEAAHLAGAINALGMPYLGRVQHGTIEGGDICLLREGSVLIGRSGERTNDAGANAVAALFEERGWEVIHTRFDPQHLHLDTLFTMVSGTCAVACTDELQPELLRRLRKMGIWLLPASVDEVRRLGSNLLSVGDNTLLVPAGNSRMNSVLQGCGFRIVEVEIDQFTRCGGGVHCLTMPLARDA